MINLDYTKQITFTFVFFNFFFFLNETKTSYSQDIENLNSLSIILFCLGYYDHIYYEVSKTISMCVLTFNLVFLLPKKKKTKEEMIF
jgi:hypothetical protein